MDDTFTCFCSHNEALSFFQHLNNLHLTLAFTMDEEKDNNVSFLDLLVERHSFAFVTILWTPTYGQAKAGRPARTYIQQLCEDTGCNPEDLSEAMNDREKWREMVKDIRTGGMTWWWWYIESLRSLVCIWIGMLLLLSLRGLIWSSVSHSGVLRFVQITRLEANLYRLKIYFWVSWGSHCWHR